VAWCRSQQQTRIKPDRRRLMLGLRQPMWSDWTPCSGGVTVEVIGGAVQAIEMFVVDDEPDIRLLVRTMVGLDPVMKIAGEAATGESAIEQLQQCSADVVVIDQAMPGISGVETAVRLKEQNPSIRTVLFTAYLTAEVRRQAAEAGIDACVAKTSIAELVTEARRVARPS